MSEPLISLLDSSRTTDEAAAEIAAVPALLEEARAVVADLQLYATAKAGVSGVKTVIGRRFATYPQPQRSEGEAVAWWADYIDTLSDLSLASLEAAMRAYVADPASEFMPKPGRLRELARTTPSRALTRFYRAKGAIRLADQRTAQDPPARDAAEVRRMLAEFQAKTMPTELRRAEPMPSTAGKPDEGGITPQMREILARREANP